LRYLVFSLAVRSGGQVEAVEDALAALSLGHVLLRLGEMQDSAALSDASRRAVRETLNLMSSSLDEPLQVGGTLRGLAAEIDAMNTGAGKLDPGQSGRLQWLLELAAHDISDHPSIFASR
jgi:hypothetical protein